MAGLVKRGEASPARTLSSVAILESDDHRKIANDGKNIAETLQKKDSLKIDRDEKRTKEFPHDVDKFLQTRRVRNEGAKDPDSEKETLTQNVMPKLAAPSAKLMVTRSPATRMARNKKRRRLRNKSDTFMGTQQLPPRKKGLLFQTRPVEVIWD